MHCAVRSLSTLAPFDQGEIGIHAQYLLARTHHLAGERPEAATGYQGLVASWQGHLREARVKLAADLQRIEMVWVILGGTR